MASRGVIYVHSAPAAVCPHVEWALAGVLGATVAVDWTRQPASPGTYRAEVSWTGEPGTGARLVSALRGWAHVRYEVTEEPSAGVEGARYSYTPQLGIYHAVTGPHGDVLVPEERIRGAITRTMLGQGDLHEELDRLLGKPWDDELEPFRQAGESATVRWLHRVG
jgi:Protein of unknown function (DUF3145)